MKTANRIAETVIRVIAVAIVSAAIVTAAGCSATGGLGVTTPRNDSKIFAAIRKEARAQAVQVVNARSDAIFERVEGKIQERVGDELRQRGIDPEEFRQSLTDIAEANQIDISAVRDEFRDKVKIESAEMATAVIDKVFGNKSTADWKQSVIDDAEEKTKKSTLAIIAGRVGPKVAAAAVPTVATALGLSGPIGAGLGLGLGAIAFVMRRRRKKKDA